MRRLFLFIAWVTVALTNYAQSSKVVTGAEQLELLLPKLSGKRVALLVNQTSIIKKTHLVDTLQSRGVKLVKIFSPEHGFRGNADAGEIVGNDTDARTGLPLVSLYGKNKKATPEQLSDVDIVIFDIQDIGARFYTYISSLHYLMEACAENDKLLIILDRPNPLGSYIDGPILQPQLKSFVGMHPIPVVHGNTIGEMAQMINGQGWLEDKKACKLDIIKMKNWKHADFYSLPVKPSPNIPNDHTIGLYPSTCFFEGTILSIGRGTQNPFEFVGHPDLKGQPFQFTPVSIEGMAKNPPLENQVCYGLDLRKESIQKQITLQHLIDLYKVFPDKSKYFNNYFNTLAGTPVLKQQIIDGLNEEQIHESWKKDLDVYKKMRAQYLLYP